MKPLNFLLNPEKAQAMSQYMRNLFPFLGVAKPERAQIERPYLVKSKEWPKEQVLQTIEENYHKQAREYQYYAIDLALKNFKRLTFSDLERLLPLLAEASWWDSIDAWRKVYAEWLKQHPADFARVAALFSQHENFWYRRIAVTLQLGFKAQTNREFLAESIEYDVAYPEFFIQKAIGWSLRDLGKTDPDWVVSFLETHELSALAYREAVKYLK